jgi:hypothetical protein
VRRGRGVGAAGEFKNEWNWGVDDHDREWDGGATEAYVAVYVLSDQQCEDWLSGDDGYECDGSALFIGWLRDVPTRITTVLRCHTSTGRDNAELHTPTSGSNNPHHLHLPT